MSKPVSLDEAIERLTAALDAFELALQRRRANEDTIAQLEEDVQLLALDRSQLANQIDGLKHREEEMRTKEREVSRRIDSAMDSIRDVLAGQGS